MMRYARCFRLACVIAALGCALASLAGLARRQATSAAGPAATQRGGASVAVETARVERRPWAPRRAAAGVIKSGLHLDVRTEVGGTILVVARPGARVRRGQTLVRLDDRAQRAELAAKQAGLVAARDNSRRADALVEVGALSRLDREAVHLALARAVSEVEALRSTLRKMNIIAPFGGVVGFHDRTRGQVISAGSALFTYDDPTRLFVEFRVPETALAALRPGSAVEVGGAAAGGRCRATVSLIDAESDPVERTVAVRAGLARGVQLRTGAGVSVAYAEAEPSTSLVIPEAAVMDSAYGQSAIVVAGGRARRRSIDVGASQDGMVQVHAGLQAGEVVVTAGQLRLYPGAQVHVAP
jgi:RND family efflux transporter MFP subunit